MEQVLYFRDRDSFMEHLLEVEEKTSWIHEVPVQDLTFHENVISPSRLSVSFRMGSDTAVRKCAMPSVYDRCGISGDSLRHMNGKVLAGVLNAAAKTREKKYCTISVVDGLVSAILSEGKSKIQYTVLKASDVFVTTQNCLWSLIDEEERAFYGAWSYEGIHAVWDTVLQKRLGGERYYVTVGLSTSDIGRGAISISALLKSKDQRIPLMDDLGVVHRNTCTINDVYESVYMLEHCINGALEGLGRLESVEVNNPVNTMKRLARKVKLPKADSLSVIADYEKENGNTVTTALECYKTLSKVLDVYEGHQKNPVYIQTCTSNILKTMGADWKKYDLPGVFGW